jgi:polyvinyl alcohol dehydrogenase (cytochrome)
LFPAASPQASPATPAPAPVIIQWPFYGADIADTRLAPNGDISSANVNQLQPAWTVTVGGPISGTPVIADGVVYIGSYDGTLDALDLASGSSVWRYDTGAQVQEPNLHIPLGITGSAAVANGVVYTGDATATVHAIDVATGTARWTRKVDTQPAACIWSSPVIDNGRRYVGIASISKETGVRGSVVALDASDGAVLWQTFMVPQGADGAGVFAVPALDPQRDVLYVGTQNAYSPNPAPFGHPTSIVALDTASGSIKWTFNPPRARGSTAPTDDVGFSASPNLFTATVNGTSRDLIGEGQKSGVYWVLDRDTGDVVWQSQISPSGPLGGMEGTSAVANGLVAVPATNWPDPSSPATGTVTVLDTASGAVQWAVQQPAPAPAPVSISQDVLFQAGIEGVLHAYELGTGTELWRADLGASVSGGIAVASGLVVLGAATPPFAPFVKPGNTVRAFVLAPTATPAPSTPTAVPTASPSAPTVPPLPTATLSPAPTVTPPGATPIG